MKASDFKVGDRVRRKDMRVMSVPAGTLGTVKDVNGETIVVLWDGRNTINHTASTVIELLTNPCATSVAQTSPPALTIPVKIHSRMSATNQEAEINRAVDVGERQIRRTLRAWPGEKNLQHSFNKDTNQVEFFWVDIK